MSITEESTKQMIELIEEDTGVKVVSYEINNDVNIHLEDVNDKQHYLKLCFSKQMLKKMLKNNPELSKEQLYEKAQTTLKKLYEY